MSFWNHPIQSIEGFFGKKEDPYDTTRGIRDSLATNSSGPLGGIMRHQKELNDAIDGSFEKGGPVKKTGIYQLHKGEYVMNKKQVAKKMKKPNDSDSLREFSRINPETGRPLFRMPEGNYKPREGRYEREDRPMESTIHG